MRSLTDGTLLSAARRSLSDFEWNHRSIDERSHRGLLLPICIGSGRLPDKTHRRMVRLSMPRCKASSWGVNVRLSSPPGRMGQCAAICGTGFFELRLLPVNRTTGNSLFRLFEFATVQSPLEGMFRMTTANRQQRNSSGKSSVGFSSAELNFH